MTSRSMTILLVEDNPGDVLLVREALSDSDLLHTLRVVVDGEDALEQLRADGVADTLPDLVLLDVRLPGISGHDVLGVIKADICLGVLPVVMLSSSARDADVRTAYERHASCYVAKPARLDDYVEAVGRIEQFWAATARLPDRG